MDPGTPTWTRWVRAPGAPFNESSICRAGGSAIAASSSFYSLSRCSRRTPWETPRFPLKGSFKLSYRVPFQAEINIIDQDVDVDINMDMAVSTNWGFF